MNNLSLSVMLSLTVLISLNKSVGQESSQPMGEPVTVGNVDLNRYAGTWYEIAKIPNRFQKQCVRNTTATYSLNKDGTLKVINRCVQEDSLEDKAVGKARVIDKKTNSKLEVSFVSIFGFHLFWGDYWIIGLDDGYQYVVVGSPSRKYGWILSRDKIIPDEFYKEAEQILIRQGYNPGDFEMTIQK